MPVLLRKNHTLVASFLIGIFLLAVLLGTGSYTSFLSIEGLIVVVGGSIANALLSYSRKDVHKAFLAIRTLIGKAHGRRHNLHKDVMRLIMWSYVVQAQGFIGLEKESAKTARDHLTRYGLDLVVSGYAADKIREMMNTVAEAEFERKCAPVAVLRNMAATAPAFGMVGTLIGMVSVMHNVGSDVAGIESGLAVAMLSTLYGILIARLVCLPAADKLLHEEEGEHFRNYMMTEGLTLLADKQKPFYMQDRLNSFLEPSQHMQLNHYMQVAFTNRVAVAA